MATGKRFYWMKLKESFMTSDTIDYLFFLSCHSFTSLNVGISCRICEDEQAISFWDGAACGMSSCYRQVLPSLCIWQHIPEALHL